jgi:tRNA pseudouridine synthase 10
MKLNEISLALLEKFALCDHCLGRQFAMLGYGFTNQERGYTIKLLLLLEGNRLILNDSYELGTELIKLVALNGLSESAYKVLKSLGQHLERTPTKCYICNGAFEYVDELANKVVEKTSQYEYKTFLLGIKIPPEVEEREDELRAQFDIKWSESIKNEFSREIGKKVSEITGKTVQHIKSDVIAIINVFTKQIMVKASPIFISGRYKKLVRGIPQHRWVCNKCVGIGCADCGWTGKKYSESIKDLITDEVKRMFEGTDAKLHSAGREDINVRVLGSGRPFIVEVKNPKKRNTDLESLKTEINKAAKEKIEIFNLSFSSKERVQAMKEKKQTKVYRGLVEFETPVSDEQLLEIEKTMENKIIYQQSPSRFSRQRSPKSRKKHLYGIEFKRLNPNLVEMLVRCQGGLYIKELVNGDDGKTTPSLAELINTSAKCIELDIMDISMEVA